MKPALVILFLVVLLSGIRYCHEHSDTHLNQKRDALNILQTVPELSTMSIPAEECSFISKNSGTSLNCKFLARVGNTAASSVSTWSHVSRQFGQDPWRRDVLVQTYRGERWVAKVYSLDRESVVGASLTLVQR